MQPLIDFGEHPIAHHFLASPGEPEYRHAVVLGFCDECGLTQLIDPIPPERLYSDYHVLSGWKWSPHVPRVVELVESVLPVSRDSPVLEVGSNDGSFLAELRDRGYTNLLGIEPARDAVEAARARGIETAHAYFTPTTARGLTCELFVARQVLEHVADLREFARAMQLVLEPGATVIVEVPDFGFNQSAPDYSAVWEEHVNHFTRGTLARFLATAGVELAHDETQIFSGQILLAVGRYTGAPLEPPELESVDDLRAAAGAYRDAWPGFRERLARYLAGEKAAGRRIALYGAGCRSCCLVNYADLQPYVDLVVDDQPEKQGKFMPGSHLPIRPSETLLDDGIDLCLLAVNAENEDRVIERQAPFRQRGGTFVSLHPPSARLPSFWRGA